MVCWNEQRRRWLILAGWRKGKEGAPLSTFIYGRQAANQRRIFAPRQISTNEREDFYWRIGTVLFSIRSVSQ